MVRSGLKRLCYLVEGDPNMLLQDPTVRTWLRPPSMAPAGIGPLVCRQGH